MDPFILRKNKDNVPPWRKESEERYIGERERSDAKSFSSFFLPRNAVGKGIRVKRMKQSKKEPQDKYI